LAVESKKALCNPEKAAYYDLAFFPLFNNSWDILPVAVRFRAARIRTIIYDG
jgi:hypothetical protein